MARVNINHTLAKAYAKEEARDRWVEPLSRRIAMAARRDAPVRTGALRLSIYDEGEYLTNGYTRRVGSRLNYSYLVQAGAPPHRIVPRNPNGRLRFYWKKVGRWVSLRSVNHPGFRKRNYLQGPLMEYGTAAGFRVILFPTI